ncbi:MAG TPA: hypothetical protein DCM86_14570 [Verrucomicrobiales bacterium]|nr:hypothetical protein [Verrucomicrobiales bacterium]
MKSFSNARPTGARRPCLAAPLAVAACLLLAGPAGAHLTYNGRDLGSYTGLEAGTKTITNQTVTGNYGWADAADGILGDSHRGRAFRFHLDHAALVTLTISANPNATTNSLGGLVPAFSIYSGLGAVAPYPPTQTALPSGPDHDFGEASAAWRTWWVQQHLNPAATDPSATDGSWDALGDWKMGGDGDLPGDFSQLSSFLYRASAAAHDGANTVTGSFTLQAGDYTVMIGGNNIANKTSDTALSPHGIAATISVTPAPALSVAQKVFVAWPATTSANWVLEASTSADATEWTPVPGSPTTVDGQAGVLLDTSAARRYFRLRYVP